MLFQIPQRYRFSSKSQRIQTRRNSRRSCFRYHKGTDFQANHNWQSDVKLTLPVVLDTTKVQIFKQITTNEYSSPKLIQLFQIPQRYRFSSKSQRGCQRSEVSNRCFRYHKGTDFQANHNCLCLLCRRLMLFQIPQRYRFSSKSQQVGGSVFFWFCCFRYHKGTDFQANHNKRQRQSIGKLVVLDTTKVQIFKQITTWQDVQRTARVLFQIPQRYRFSSKSQHHFIRIVARFCCFRYHKGTDFQANHNPLRPKIKSLSVVLDTTKVQIFKQITTNNKLIASFVRLFQIPQRYRFSSKSQQQSKYETSKSGCFRYHKGTDFQANHNVDSMSTSRTYVVLDTTKVQIFKQITTGWRLANRPRMLFQIPQRYRFSSKSQQVNEVVVEIHGCFRYHKGTDFQANHN